MLKPATWIEPEQARTLERDAQDSGHDGVSDPRDLAGDTMETVHEYSLDQ